MTSHPCRGAAVVNPGDQPPAVHPGLTAASTGTTSNSEEPRP
jgi:hypothetical protein